MIDACYKGAGPPKAQVKGTYKCSKEGNVFKRGGICIAGKREKNRALE